MTELCPCGSTLPYATCCGPFHHGTALPNTAEQLMRSRYSAFACRIPQYLFDTLHPSKRAPNELAMLEKAVGQHNWQGLQIVSTQQGQADDTEGFVAFRATYIDAGQTAVLEENSSFIKVAGQWFYLQGQFAPEKLPGRNDPCWCGSGKKFKKCHGQA